MKLWAVLSGVLLSLATATTDVQHTASTDNRHGPVAKRQTTDGLQDLVTWDGHSLFVRGERLFIFSGEFHPFRLPVPGLWLDVFQKIKAMGFNGVSFYTDWGLLEGQEGRVVTDGIWSLSPFFDAAKEAGIYLIGRPGPYINAEVSAGGFPGWALRINCTLRTTCPEYLDATQNYVSTIVSQMADVEVTKGGPVILIQPENEYTTFPNVNLTDFPQQPQKEYMAAVEQQFRDAGATVPLIDNDNEVMGDFAPGTGLGAIDIYAIDAYPLRYDCADPTVWPTIRWPQNWQTLHEEQSPTTPFAIAEFQGGSGTSFEGVNQDMCNALVNEEAARVVYKNNYSFGAKLFNIYMTFGGTNWGNLGYQGGDTSYDYGAAITEDRHVWREKYSEQKLQANFFKVSPAYLTATPGNVTNGSYASSEAVAVTPLYGNGTDTNFYVVRHADWTSRDNKTFSVSVPTTVGYVTIPQLGGQLQLFGRDSKIYVTDYALGNATSLIYSTAEVFTWATGNSGHTTLVLYGGAGETHEFALPSSCSLTSGADNANVKSDIKGSALVVQWQVTKEAQGLTFGDQDLEILLLWRNDAYNLWTPELPASDPVGNFSSPSKDFVIVKAGYLVRSASIDGTTLKLTGDINATTDIEVIFEPSGKVTDLTFNGEPLTSIGANGSIPGAPSFTIGFEAPSIDIPDLTTTEWKFIDSLPEIRAGYDDSSWTSCNHTTTTNPQLGLLTPNSLYASDYGYHTGSLIYRGHFTTSGTESTVYLNVSGGYAFAHSVWLNDTFLGSWVGANSNQTYAQTLELPSDIAAGQAAVLTVLIDHMGQTEAGPGNSQIQFPLGLLNYDLAGHQQTDITWVMTGNLGGEDYADLVRGPRNEGAMYIERQGYHLPAPPSQNWNISSPTADGLSTAGVGFFSTSFNLFVPRDYDVPMSFVFNNNELPKDKNYRVQLFVNGYQFGKFVSNLGPETAYPVPEGILDYDGENWVGLTLWSLDAGGATLDSLELVPMMPVKSGYSKPALSPLPAFSPRPGAY